MPFWLNINTYKFFKALQLNRIRNNSLQQTIKYQLGTRVRVDNL